NAAVRVRQTGSDGTGRPRVRQVRTPGARVHDDGHGTGTNSAGAGSTLRTARLSQRGRVRVCNSRASFRHAGAKVDDRESGRLVQLQGAAGTFDQERRSLAGGTSVRDVAPAILGGKAVLLEVR